MFANYLAAAFRNLARNWLYAGVMVLGLSIGMATAMLVALFVRDELTFDQFIPGHEQVYRIYMVSTMGGTPNVSLDNIQPMVAPTAKLADPRIVAAARLVQAFPQVRAKPGDTPIVDQSFAWADPEIFKVLPLPALSGDPATALEQPDGLAITRRVARTYFHRDNPLGETLWVEGRPMRVKAVLQDLPPNTHLVAEIYASARAGRNLLAQADADPTRRNSMVVAATYLRIAKGASGDWLNPLLMKAVARPLAASFGAPPNSDPLIQFRAVKLADVHMRPQGMGDIVRKPAGDMRVLAALSLVAGLTLLVAAINFVTLMTARAGRRAVEVGVRKVAGASRAELVVQFLGEALVYAAIAAVAGVAMVELALKPFSALVQQPVTFNYLSEPGLVLIVVAGALAIGVTAGLYPAFVLSSFKPAAVLKGGVVKTAGSALARQALVVVQFAVLIGLVATTATIYRQTRFAVEYGLGDKADRLYGVWTECQDAFPEQVRRLPGVEAAACSSLAGLNSPAAISISSVRAPGGPVRSANMPSVDYGFLEMMGQAPIAGRGFSRAFGKDGLRAQPDATGQPSIIINETAVRRFGFASPQAAVGKTLLWPQIADRNGRSSLEPSEIVGVVADRPMSVRAPAEAALYHVNPHNFQMLVVRTERERTAEAVAAIRKLWKATGHGRPIQEVFMAESRRNLYRDVIIQGATVAVCAGLALFIACLGLFALSAYTAERRTKEIGVRKALGAGTRDVLGLLIWQFTLPVLVANLIAWPAAFLIMRWWLNGFAYRVDLGPWTFVAAGGAALAIAWATVFVHALKVARAKPVGALRYE
jgi:putative ABC transport system permease protein